MGEAVTHLSPSTLVSDFFLFFSSAAELPLFLILPPFLIHAPSVTSFWFLRAWKGGTSCGGWGGRDKSAVVLKQKIIWRVLCTRVSSVTNISCCCPHSESVEGVYCGGGPVQAGGSPIRYG